MHYSLAPLAGYTDLPFRRICRAFGLNYASTALIDAGALAHGNPDSDFILHRGEDEPWLQVQLLGSLIQDLRLSVRLLRDGPWHFDALDFNMGCPVRKVLKRGAGAALPRTPEHALECLKMLRDEWPGPLTVKMRILDETCPDTTLAFAKQLQDIGIQGLAIHGRIAQRIYSGPVHAPIIRAVREHLSIPVTANGGVFSFQDALRLSQESNCTRIMVARGAIGNPWLFRELAAGKNLPPPPREEVLQVAEEHLAQMVTEYGEKPAMILGRKILCGYLHGRGFSHELKGQIVHITTWEDFQRLLALFRASPPLP